MLGKKKCRMLREIRKKIASENDIPLVTEDCKFKGDCKGTCPKCEAELRYLEAQLEKRRSLGKKVTVSALALGLVATGASACGRQTAGMPEPLEGDVPYIETDTAEEPETYAPEGEAPTEDPSGEEIELLGDVLSVPDDASQTADA